MAVRIIVDSTCDTTDEMKKHFTVVPLTIRFGDEEFIDGVNMSHAQFYERLVETEVLPTTSQATPGAFLPIFEELTQAGDSAVVIMLSSKLSGTYESAVTAATGFNNIFVIDSESACIGSGILAEYAYRLVEQGISAKEIAHIIEGKKSEVQVVAMLDTLEYLKRGGRISKTAALAGGLLNIKPVITLKKGEIEVLGKARGSKQGNNLLIKAIEKTGGVDFNMPVLLGYTGLEDSLLQKYIKDSSALWADSVDELRQTVVSGVIGTHTGPNCIAVAYFGKN